MGMGVVLDLMLQLCIIAFAVAAQGSKGSILSPSPLFLPAIPPITETLGPINHGESKGGNAPSLPPEPDGLVMSPTPANLHTYPSPIESPGSLPRRDSSRNIAPSFPPVPNGSFSHPPNIRPLPSSAPTPQMHKDIEPFISPSSSPAALSPPHDVIPSPSTAQGNMPPSVKSSPPPRKAPFVRPPAPTPTAPAPVAIPSGRSPENSPVSQPGEHGNLAPNVDDSRANKSHTAEPISPTPIVTPSTNVPKNSPRSQPTEHQSYPPQQGTNKGHGPGPISPAPFAVNLPKTLPVSHPPEHGSLPPNAHQRNANTGHTLEPISPVSAAKPPATLKENSPVSQPTQHGSIPPNVKRSTDEGHTPEPVSPKSVASPPWEIEHIPPVTHPIFPITTPSILPAPATSPISAFPVNKPLVHPNFPVVSPSKLPASVPSPTSTPSRSTNWRKDGEPAAEPLYKTPKPLTDVIHSPARDRAIPPSLSSASGKKHHVPLPMNPVSPSKSFIKSPKMLLLPQIHALPPPPPNEDCLSTVCSEPYVTSPPGAPCRCVSPMRVGLRLSVPLYTFFPLVSELASEIATGVFMKQSQIRIMGANEANQEPEKTVVLIDLVPLGENFDNTTAFLTFDRFWHKKVVIKAYYFGDYDVLYVSYPGLPLSPPLPPSSIPFIYGDPYSTVGNNGGAIKPLGVDIHKSQHKGGLSRGIIAIVAVSVFLAAVLCTAVAWVMFKFRDHVSQLASTPRLSPPSLTKTPGSARVSLIGNVGAGSNSSSFRSSIAAYTGSSKTFSMNDLEKATDNFHASRILGEGGFGRVYGGVLGEGTKVAVKVLMRDDHHGDREFLAEVEMLSRLHHRNLVKLIGICAEDSFRGLVYELIPNGSVESHLHGVDKENCTLDWGARMKIALGAARGLAYLHEDSSPSVIHRDFKSSNILLEDDFTPKVADFGLARAATDGQNIHISTRVMGTFGYVAPEYAMTGHLLVKSDVYSYGVVLLELLTGRKPVDMSQAPGQENLVAWARPLLASNEGLKAIIDPSVGADVPFDIVAKVAAIASMCVQPEVSNRPFMGEVVQALKLVCSECEEAKEDAVSRSSSQEDLSVVLDGGASTVSGQLQDERHFSASHFNSEVDIERCLSASEQFSSSARVGRRDTESFRRNSYSEPLRSERSTRLWKIIRRLSGGSASEHGTMFKL
ncbi:receptor-like serine/threonine-protein kinase ALE2 [Lotus japonicus]|uniref:receptor-like serine/threonine-protein kinase ALE2 n=1 Tax=Lotus japonicus TaxID=34305 RepID=UPI002586F01E|nr:receptor-like serine/threonine-protein kinase ALE2 [Lotus japonicus]